MNACVYARTSRAERGPHTTTIANQIEFCLALAHRHNLTVRHAHIFSDPETLGSVPPTCWATEADEQTRPALSALIEAVSSGEVQRVLLRRIEKLGTAYDHLHRLLQLFQEKGVRVIVDSETVALGADPRARFAAQILAPCIQYDTEVEMARKARQKAEKLEELARLRGRVARLEAEVQAL